MAASIQCYAAGGSANNGEFGLDSRRPRMYEPWRSIKVPAYTKSSKREQRGEERRGEEERGDDEKEKRTVLVQMARARPPQTGKKSPKAPTPLHIHLRSFGGMDEKTLVPNASRCRPWGLASSSSHGRCRCRCRDGGANKARRRGKIEASRAEGQTTARRRTSIDVWSQRKDPRPKTQELEPSVMVPVWR